MAKTQITVPAENARLLDSLAEYPPRLLQWVSDVLYGYANTAWELKGEAERVEDPAMRLETVLDAFREQAVDTHNPVTAALLEIYREVWSHQDKATEAEIPTTWDAWSLEEREIWQEIQDQYAAAYKAEDDLTAALSERLPSHRMQAEKIRIETEVIGHIQVRLVAARLRRYRPDLADLIDFAAGDSELFPSGSPHEFSVT